jgi:hypothetical protein
VLGSDVRAVTGRELMNNMVKRKRILFILSFSRGHLPTQTLLDVRNEKK